jgi:hypothetical protein
MKKIIMITMLAVAALAVKAQDTIKTTNDSPLVIFGSVDAYYKYDFSEHSNIPTSFATDQNSFSIGMLDLGLKKKVGKAAFVGELSFGPRGQAQSIPNGAGGDSYHIQNLYVSYDLADSFTLTGGYMGTFIGYEVISPVGNFHYSTSYLFTNGPFQNAGVKATYTLSPKASLMVGLFNDEWNVYTSNGRINAFGAQLMLAPVTGWTAYLNVLSGPASGTVADLTTAYQITNAFKLGLNAASKTGSGLPNYKGVALYPSIAVAKSASIGVRGEYFKFDGAEAFAAVTFTANIKSGPLTFIPEARLDGNKAAPFKDKNGVAAKSASQFLLAAVYTF